MRISARRLVVGMTCSFSMFSAGVRGRPPVSLIGLGAIIRRRWHQVSSLLLCDILVVMQRDPIPVRERTRRAVRGELAQLAVGLFVEKGYDETTIDDLAAARSEEHTSELQSRPHLV